MQSESIRTVRTETKLDDGESIDIFCIFCALSVAEPTVWNSLPDDLRDPSVDSEHIGET